jgi:hypothetical protein
MTKLVINNVSWDGRRYNAAKKVLIPFAKKVSNLLQLKNDLIVSLYHTDKKNKDVRSEYDEGTIILYEGTPDIRGDFAHELAHQIYPEHKMSLTGKSKLNRIKRKLDQNKGDGRIFIQDHTYKDIEEVWCTLFKWYVLGKTMDKAYLGILKSFQPDGIPTVEYILQKEEIIKSKAELQADIVDLLMKSINNEKEDAQLIDRIKGVSAEKLSEYKLNKSQLDTYCSYIVEEVMNRKHRGRYGDLMHILSNRLPEARLDSLNLHNPVGINTPEDFELFVKSGFNKKSENTLTFHLGIPDKTKKELMKGSKK